MNEVTYVSGSRKISVIGSFRELYHQVFKNRFLIGQLLKRDLVASNKRGLFKYFWIFISPVMTSVSWVFLSKVGVLTPGDSGVPYPLFVLLGTSIWALGIGLITMVGTTLTSTGAFITKIKFPHEIFFVKNFIHQILLFSIGFILNIIVLFLSGIPFGFKMLLFPIVLLPLILLATGIGLVVSMLNVIVSDAGAIVTTVLGVLIYLTPVLFTGVDNEYLKIAINLNPFTHLVASPRDILLFGRLYSSVGFYLSCIFAVVIFAVCLTCFYRAKSRLIEKMI